MPSPHACHGPQASLSQTPAPLRPTWPTLLTEVQQATIRLLVSLFQQVHFANGVGNGVQEVANAA
jgi:hypothetical protein